MMFLECEDGFLIDNDEIVGIFDTDSVISNSNDFLKKAQAENRIKNISNEIPKSFIVLKNNEVYFSMLSAGTFYKRNTQKINSMAEWR